MNPILRKAQALSDMRPADALMIPYMHGSSNSRNVGFAVGSDEMTQMSAEQPEPKRLCSNDRSDKAWPHWSCRGLTMFATPAPAFARPLHTFRSTQGKLDLGHV